METLTHIPSNMTNDECFRLTGALPTARIVELLDEADRFRDAVQTVKEQLDAVDAALPNEDFAADVVYDLAQLRDDETAIDEPTAARLTAIIKDLERLQGEQWKRNTAASKAQRLIEDALAEWTDS
jgi:hypothetical protein